MVIICELRFKRAGIRGVPPVRIYGPRLPAVLTFTRRSTWPSQFAFDTLRIYIGRTYKDIPVRLSAQHAQLTVAPGTFPKMRLPGGTAVPAITPYTVKIR